MMLSVALFGVAALLALAVLALLMVRSPLASRLIYTACMIVTAASLAAALSHLLTARPPEELTLPIGLPWLGAHLRLDALSAFFLVVVDLVPRSGRSRRDDRQPVRPRLAMPLSAACRGSCQSICTLPAVRRRRINCWKDCSRCWRPAHNRPGLDA